MEVVIDSLAGRQAVPLVNVWDCKDQEASSGFWATSKPIALSPPQPGQQIAAKCRWRQSASSPWTEFSEKYRFHQFDSTRIVVIMGLDWASFVYKVSEEGFLPLAGCALATTAPTSPGQSTSPEVEDDALEGVFGSTSPSQSETADGQEATACDPSLWHLLPNAVAEAVLGPIEDPRLCLDRGLPTRGDRGKPRTHVKQLMVVLRGLPFGVTEADVKEFIEASGAGGVLASVGDCGQPPIRILKNAQGRPSGFAEVDLSPAEGEALRTIGALHMRQIGGRYVEVLPPKAPPRPRQRRWRREAAG